MRDRREKAEEMQEANRAKKSKEKSKQSKTQSVLYHKYRKTYIPLNLMFWSNKKRSNGFIHYVMDWSNINDR
ncbi:MAG: hypothetical protein ACRCZO_14190 [Cetobacterium sp.]